MAGAGILFQAELQGELEGGAVVLIFCGRLLEPFLLRTLCCGRAWWRWLVFFDCRGDERAPLGC